MIYICILNRYVFFVRSKSTCIGEEDFPHNEKYSRCIIFEWEVVLGAPDKNTLYDTCPCK